MESTRNLNSAKFPPIVGETRENNPSKVVEISAVSLGKHHEDFAMFSEACKICSASISKERTMEGNNTSPEESSTKNGSLIEVPERMGLGTEYIKAGDVCSKTENTAQAVKEFSNTENNSQSYNGQEKQAPQIYCLNLSKSINSDHTDANETKIQQSQWCLSENKTGMEDSCFQTHGVCTQVTTAANVLNLRQDTLVDCREWTLPKDVDREVEENKDASFNPGSNAVSSRTDLVLSVGTEGNIPNDVPITHVRHLQNYDYRTLEAVCSVYKDVDISFDAAIEADISTKFAAANSVTTTSSETEKSSTLSVPKGSNFAAFEEAKISPMPTLELNVCAASIDRYNFTKSTPKVDSSTISTPKVDIPAHLAGDSMDVSHVPESEIPDFSDLKISEISPNINETEETKRLENVSQNVTSCCANTHVSNYPLKDVSTFANSEKQEPDSYAMENALFLVRSYISELERVAKNIEKILSDSSHFEMNKKDHSKFKVSDSLVEFESNDQLEIKGDNLEDLVGNVSTELSDPLADMMSMASAEVVDVKEDIVSLDEDFQNQSKECKPEYMSTVQDDIPARCDEANPGLHCESNRGMSVPSSNEVRAFASDPPPHNVNNNSHCFVSANIDTFGKHATFSDKTSENNPWLGNYRKTHSDFFPVCTKTQDAKGHSHYISVTAVTSFQREDPIYANMNNNGNTTSVNSKSRNLTMSSEPGSCPTTHRGPQQSSLKTRTQHFRNNLTTPGNDILVFEGSRVYSMTQKDSHCKELVGKFVSDVRDTKHDCSDTSLPGHTHHADSQLSSCQSVKFSEINDGLTGKCEKSGNHQNIEEVNETHNFETCSEKLSDGRILSSNEKVNNEGEAHLDNSNKGTSQISNSESTANYPPNVVLDDFEMPKVNSPANAKHKNIFDERVLQPMIPEANTKHKNIFDERELQPMIPEAKQQQQNAKRSRNTRRSRNKACWENKHQCLQGKYVRDFQLMDVLSSAEGDTTITKRKTEQGSSSLHNWQSAMGSTSAWDNRWASALGSNDSRCVDVTKLECQRKRNFPVRIRTFSKHSQQDMYIPARTRRLTVESPAENLLVHTSYDRPNPKNNGNAINIEMTNQRSVLYLGAEDDYIDTNGTRRLVCETECLSCKDPKTMNLVIENRALDVSDDTINSVPEETKKGRENGISVVTEEITRSGSQLLEVGQNVGNRHVKWCGASCARMIGDFIVIGTAKSIRSVVNTVQNQMKYSITADGNSETANLPEAGDVGNSTPRKAAVGDRGRGDESGDHLTVALTDRDYINSNNNNVCMQGEINGWDYRHRLHDEVQEPIHCGYHGSVKTCMSSAWYSTHRLNGGLVIVTQTDFFLGSHANVNIYKVIMEVIYQLGNNTIRRIYCRLCCLPANSTLAMISCEPNRNSSACENSDLRENASRNRNEANTETVNLENVTFAKDHKSKHSCQSCLHINQMTYQHQNVELADLMTPVDATDSNLTEESQTSDNSHLLLSMHSHLRNSQERLSLIEDDVNFRQHKKEMCHFNIRNCSSCSQLSSNRHHSDELTNQNKETQVHATDVNPSNLAQTGKSLVLFAPLLPLQSETITSARGTSSDTNLRSLFYEFKKGFRPTGNFLRNLSEVYSLPIVFSSEHPKHVPVISSQLTMYYSEHLKPVLVTSYEIIPEPFTVEQNRGNHCSEHKYEQEFDDENPVDTFVPQLFCEHTYYKDDFADENPVSTFVSRGLYELEMQEARLIWQNNAFMPQKMQSETRCGPDPSVCQHVKSELELFMPDVDVFGSHGNFSQCVANPINYIRNTVDYKSGECRVESIPTSRMALTVLDPDLM
ncbi:hypothetical protein BsWGS_28789 [Bradybaena similaris]